MVEAGQPERRHAKRISFIHEVEVEGLGKLRCLDISCGGMYLESPTSFPKDTVVDLQIKLQESDSQPIRSKARVVYVHEGVGMGLSFIELSEQDSDKIRELVEKTP